MHLYFRYSLSLIEAYHECAPSLFLGFRVYWNGEEGSYPGDSENNSCAANGCKTTSDGSCVCKTTMEESAVFTNSSVTKDDVLSNLFMGVFGPPDSSIATDLGNGVTAHVVGGSVDGNTVFEVEDKGKFLFLKNLLSTVSLEGWSMTPQIYEAEDSTMHEAVSSLYLYCVGDLAC